MNELGMYENVTFAYNSLSFLIHSHILPLPPFKLVNTSIL